MVTFACGILGHCVILDVSGRLFVCVVWLFILRAAAAGTGEEDTGLDG